MTELLMRGRIKPLPPEAEAQVLACPPKYRDQLRELYWHAERNEADPEYHRRRAREAQAKERERLLLVAHSCFKGRRGKEARELVEFYLLDRITGKRRDDMVSLQTFEREFEQLKKPTGAK
jgi:hypothetical protein